MRTKREKNGKYYFRAYCPKCKKYFEEEEKVQNKENKTNAEHPIQPLIEDEASVLRFKRNEIVCFLLDAGPYDMNKLAVMSFSDKDREQFAQLIGYSFSGFQELNYVSDETCDKINRQLEFEYDYLRNLSKICK